MTEKKDEPKPAADAGAASEDPEDSQAFKYAAEGATAVWDAAAFREAGMEELHDHVEKHDAQKGPATGPDVGGDDRASVVVAKVPAIPPAVLAPPVADPPGGLSWPMTLLIAATLGGVTYFVITLVR